MVLAMKVGKERSFGLVLLLGIVTFGVYFIYWHYKAHVEVFKQFELDREGRDEGIVWMILGYVLFQPLLWVYQYIFVKNIAYVRERLGLGGGITPGRFLGMTIPGGIVMAIGFFMTLFGALMLASEAGDVDDPEALTPAEADDARALGGILLPIGLVLALGGIALVLVPYFQLQRDINAVWRAYDQRMRSLTTPGPGAPGVPAGTAAPGAAWSAARPPAPPAPPPSSPPRWQ